MILTFILMSVCLSLLSFLFIKMFNIALKRYEAHFKGQAKHNLTEIFLFLDPVQLWSAAFLCCLVCMMGVWFVTSHLFISLIVGGIFLFLPPFIFHRLKKQRLHRFEMQLPHMLTALSGALKAGSGVQSALKLVVQESEAPLSQEFGLMLREQRLGLSLEQALDNLLSRMPAESTQLVVASLKISAQTGGNLAEALERVAQTLRDIQQIRGKIDALTSQGRMQMKAMVGVPIVLMLVMNFGEVNTLSLFLSSQTGWLVLALIIFLEICGIFFIRRIINIDV
ncbi:type II secretion system F family protein [Pelistega ratti]|uniref:type II secretion system F family protein n=1 Tax=Pelistega ratti TaxID=2652177 RepID=UPI00135BFE46|nr:type II secretion system F family protein [Pelistega ratti]